ncbi:peptidoglycan-binding protein [Ornithinibacillus sp. 179-J 7C1 HS]|uniref:peptidoglycan-binding protein n=1 Tax=Ornithinibacillus sp. 179-J 7C1 HS TaxID=3142384 RepID=UPI0039A01603
MKNKKSMILLLSLALFNFSSLDVEASEEDNQVESMTPEVVVEEELVDSPTDSEESQPELDVHTSEDESIIDEEIPTEVNETSITIASTTTFELGDYSEAVAAFKKKLVQLGFANWPNPSQYYGNETVEVVKDFQSTYGLSVTGSANQATQDKVDELLSQPFQYGVTLPGVRQFKLGLIELGFGDWSNPTNEFGWTTLQAVKKFQSYYGLTDSGVMDQASLDKLDEELSSPKIGSYTNTVQNLKEDLVFLLYADWNGPSPYYGPETVGVVKEFQKANKLVINGIADSVTRNKISSLMEQPMKYGLIRKDVQIFKEKLVEIGMVNWKDPSAWYGPDTKAIVEKFQRYYGLTVSGVMNEESLDKLETVLNSPQFGDYNNEVQSYKEKLVELGFANWNGPSQYFGSETIDVVKDFQRHYGLITNGILDEITVNQIEKALNDIMQLNDASNAILEMKLKLVNLKFADWPDPSNWFGPETQATVEEFQRYYNLPVSGKMNPASLFKLDEVYNSPLQSGNSSKKIQDVKKDLASIGFVNWKNPGTDFGPMTKEAVEYFQRYYGLKAHGIMDEPTLAKIKEVKNSPIQYGKANNQVLQVKRDLVRLNFADWKNPSNWFGPETEEVVKAFQRYFGLVPNGIVDDVTLSAIHDELESSSTRYDLTLSQALDMQMKVNPQTDKYRNEPAYVSASYITISTGGKIIENGVRLRTTPKLNTDSNIAYTVNDGTAVTILDTNVTGDTYNGSSKWYKIQYMGKELYVHNSLANVSSKIGITKDSVNIRAGAGTAYQIYTKVPKGTTLTIVKEGSGWHQVSIGAWRNATREDVKYYLDPTNFINDEKQKFQFLDLSKPSGVTVSTLNNYLKGKGILEGQGQAFYDASRKNGVNDLYLVSHALLETGHGSSQLARGVKYNGVTVYNMYGIGAYDNCALTCGARKAYEEGWTTPYKAIVGGAKFIGDGYINAGQNTLYKMRWNPAAMEANGSASHQYATDIGWAYKQISSLYNLYQEVGNYRLMLDYPIYK